MTRLVLCRGCHAYLLPVSSIISSALSSLFITASPQVLAVSKWHHPVGYRIGCLQVKIHVVAFKPCDTESFLSSATNGAGRSSLGGIVFPSSSLTTDAGFSFVFCLTLLRTSSKKRKMASAKPRARIAPTWICQKILKATSRGTWKNLRQPHGSHANSLSSSDQYFDVHATLKALRYLGSSSALKICAP